MSYLTTDEQQALYLIKTDADQARQFFARAKSLKWFLPLKEEGYFDPSTIKLAPDGNTAFWDVLDYLERVSEQVADKPEYGRELLEIIDHVVKYSKEERPIRNYHVWWYCVKILNNIPFDAIREYITVEMFREWLSAWTDHSTVVVDLGVVDIGEKLLPKFLEDGAVVDNRYHYAETIIDFITEPKVSDSLGHSAAWENVTLGLDLFWIQHIFKKYHEVIGRKCSTETVLRLGNNLKSTLQYKHQSSYVDIETGLDARQDTYRIKAVRFAMQDLKPGEIGFVEGHYKCIVAKFSRDQVDEAEESEYFGLMDIEPQYELKSYDFFATDVNDFIAELMAGLPAHVHWPTTEVLEQKLKGIFDKLCSDYTFVWCKSLKDGPEHYEAVDAALTVVLRDVLLSCCKARREEAGIVLNAFLGSEYCFPVFRRFVLLCVDEYWTDYSDLLETFLNLLPGALEKSDFEIELHDVFRNHGQQLGPSFTAKLRELIGTVPEYYTKKGAKSSAYWQYRWLSPLRNNTDFSPLYEEAKRKADVGDDGPYEPVRSTIKAGFVGHASPVSKEEVLGKPADELVKYLNEFKGAAFWQATFDGEPDREGLALILREAVRDNPEKFTDEMKAFCDVKDHSYVRGVFMGLADVWKSERDLDWERIFEFCIIYLGRDHVTTMREVLESEGEDSGDGRHIWVVDEVVDLIAAGCKDDKRAFDPKYFGRVEQIFTLILPLLKVGGHPDSDKDALMFALNTTLGRTIMAYVSFSLRILRVRGQSEENWGSNRFERFSSIGTEGTIWFGCYIAQILNLDRHYAEEKIIFFEKKPSDDFEWRMFMEGFLKGAWLTDTVYRAMRQNYIKALKTTVFSEMEDKRLSQHISYAYLYFGEPLPQKEADNQDSLLWIMLIKSEASVKLGRWLEVPSFLWTQTSPTLRKDVKDKFLEFWAWTHDCRDFVHVTLGDKYGLFLTRMARLVIVFDQITEIEEEWLSSCILHIRDFVDATSLLKHLARLDDQESIKCIGRLFLKLLENNTPTYGQQDVMSIVTRIYERGNRDDANAICNTYARRGIHFLRPVWEKYKQKTGT